ncbi:MAG: ABC transporter permease [Vicinamibacterales bacterium]|nr:ABC transporter permease [Vicinamibacterales bacterium]
MHGMLALAHKDLTLLVRNKGHLFFSFGWPLIIAFFFGLLFAGPPEGASRLAVALVDEDASDASQALAARLTAAEALTVTPMSREDALAAVRRGRQVAAVIVPPGFGAASQRMFYGEPAQIALAVDPSRRAEASMLEGMLMGAVMQGFERLFTDATYTRRAVDQAMEALETSREPVPGRPDLERFLGALRAFVDSPAASAPQAPGATGQAWTPVTITKTDVSVRRAGPANAFMVTFPQGVLWGVIGCAFGFAMSLVTERTRGTLVRLRVAPLTRAHVLGGKALACFTAILAVEVLLFGIAALALDVIPTSLPLLALAGVSLAIGFVGIMMLISVIGETEQTVGGLAWAILLPMAMFGGGMVPLFVMPGWMQAVSNVSPVKWGILALEGGERPGPCARVRAGSRHAGLSAAASPARWCPPPRSHRRCSCT